MSEIQQGDAAAPDPLEDLVFQYLEERERGSVGDVDEFCRRHPDSGASLRERLEALARAGLLDDSSGGDERFPERLGEFRLLRRLGRGGMGVVYEAEQSNLGRRVALKLIRPEQMYFPMARERFRREVEAVARLAHPGIVAIYSFGEEGGLPYFAMEHVEGASLADVLHALAGRAPETLTARDLGAAVAQISGTARGRSALYEGPWVEACLRIAEQVAQALQHAHERGVLHRDVKPSNVMLTPDGRARLLDFGLATQTGAVRLTRTGAQLGSLAYMPPERLAGGEREATAKGDVYSLGATLYELLTLRLPFSAPSETELCARIADGRPVAPRRLNSALALDAETVCLAAMDADPARRYASAADFARDLGCVLERRPIAARRAGTLRVALRWSQRHPARALAAGLAALVVVGGPLGFGFAQRAAAAQVRRHGEELGEAKRLVDSANADLTGANARLVQQQAALSAALERESTERERAQRNVGLARRAVVEMLTDVGADELEDVPQMGPVRQRLLEKSLVFFQELVAGEPSDLALRREQALAGRAIADVLRDVGRLPAAKDEYVRQVERLRALQAEDPADAETRFALAGCLNELAAMRQADGELEPAARDWEEATALLEPLAAGPDARFIDVYDYCTALLSLGFSHFAAGRLEEAWELDQHAMARARELLAAHPQEPKALALFGSAAQASASVAGHLAKADESARLYAEAFDTLREVVTREPGKRSARVDLVEVASNYGLQLLTKSDPQRTGEVLKLAFETATGLVDDFPDDPEYRKRMAVVGVNLAVHYANQERFAEAAPILAASRAALEQLIVDHPGVIEYPYFLGAVLSSCAGVDLRLGELERATEAAELSVTLLRDVLTRLPGHTGVTAQLASALVQLGNVERARGGHAQALVLIDEALALGMTRADVLYQTVETLGSCSLAIVGDAALDEGARAAALQACVERAVDTLRAAIAHGYTDVSRLRSAPELALLREDAGFREQLEALAASAK